MVVLVAPRFLQIASQAIVRSIIADLLNIMPSPRSQMRINKKVLGVTFPRITACDVIIADALRYYGVLHSGESNPMQHAEQRRSGDLFLKSLAGRFQQQVQTHKTVLLVHFVDLIPNDS